MLQDEFTSALQVKNPDELLAEVVGFTQRLGFEKVGAMAVVDRVGGDAAFFGVDNAPDSYRVLSDRKDYCRRDPVMQHCKRVNVPIAWNQATYTSVGEGAKWEEQARYGYAYGICFAMHLPGGLHFLLGVDRDQPLPACRKEVARLTAELQLFTVYAQEPAFRALLPPFLPTNVPVLTPRELESLRWTMEGKTAWELGRILGISEQTAVRHLNNATHKLDCVNKHHAVVKALRLGLVR